MQPLQKISYGIVLIIFLFAQIVILNGDPGDDKWEYQVGYHIHSSPAIGFDGTLYFGSDDHYIYAVNPDGTLKWKVETGSLVRSSPAIDGDGRIYIGSYDDKLYALDTNGTILWTFETGNDIQTSPAIGDDGTLYFGSNDHYIYAVDKNGNLKWKYKTEDKVRNSSPAIGYDGTIYIGSTDDSFYAIHPDGTLRWKHETTTQFHSSPAIGFDGTIYCPNNDTLFAINPDGSVKWHFEIGTINDPHPTIGYGGVIYIGNEAGTLYAINPDGTQEWVFQSDIPMRVAPLLGADSTIYISSGEPFYYRLFCLDIDGKPLWNIERNYNNLESMTLKADGTLYYVSQNSLHAIEGNGGGLAKTQWPMFKHDIRHTGRDADFTMPEAEFSVTPLSGDINTTFNFDATACRDAEDDKAALRVRWDWENDGTWDTEYTTNKYAEHQYTQFGTYRVKMEVIDSDGMRAFAEQSLEVTAEGLVAYYPFNENANDESGNESHGVVHDALLTTDRFNRTNRAYEFDQSWINVDSMAYSQLQDYTISLWINPAEIKSENQSIINNYKNASENLLNLALLSSVHDMTPGGIQLFYNDAITTNGTDSITSTIAIDTDQWTHIGLVKNRDSLKLYINGTLNRGMQITQEGITNSQSWKIGKLRDNTHYFEGKIDDIRLYSKAITTADLQDIFYYGKYPTADFTISPEYGNVDTEFTFDASGSHDPFDELADLQVKWNWDNDLIWDTDYSTGKTATHQFETPAVHSIILKVKNELGLTDTQTKQLRVSKGTYSEPINDSLTLYADKIEEVKTGKFMASGNVRIGNETSQLLYFSGDVTLDKSGAPLFTYINGKCDIYVGEGGDHDILTDQYFWFEAVGQRLTLSDYLTSLFSLGGFSVNFLGLEFDFDNNSINMPASFDFQTDFLQDASVSSHFSVILPVGEERSYEGDIKFESFNIFNLFQLSLLHIWYEKGPPEVIGGEAEISWPASEMGAPGVEYDDSDVDFKIVDKFSKDTVYIEKIERVDPELLASMGLPFSGLGVKLEFVSGKLNTIVLSVDTQIPLGNSGLYLTQLTGGVGDLVTQPWWFTLGCDISGGPEIPGCVPGIGGESIVKLDDITATLWPVSRFEGSGSLALVGNSLAEGTVILSGDTLVEVTGTVNLKDIVVGTATIKLKPYYFSGTIIATIKIPENLPWALAIFEGKVLASRQLNLTLDKNVGYPVATATLTLAGLPDPHLKLTFNRGNPPYFHCYVGKNFKTMYKLFKPLPKKSTRGKQYFSFMVNTPFTDMMIAVKDSLNASANIAVKTPKGKEINRDNIDQFGGIYEQIGNQYYLAIDGQQVTTGDWELIIDTDTPVELIQHKIIAEGLKPTITMLQPEEKRTVDRIVKFQISNPEESQLDYKIYYDDNQADFDGYLLKKGNCKQSNTIEYTIESDRLSPGDYYFYVIVTDQNSYANYSTYTKGSVHIENTSDLPVPDNFVYSMENDSLHLNWITPTQDFKYYQLNIKNIITEKVNSLILNSTANHYSMDTTLIQSGGKYRLSLQTTDTKNFGRESNIVEVNYITESINNNPLFLTADTVLNTDTEEVVSFAMVAEDPDSDPLSYSIKTSHDGISLSGNEISFSPSAKDVGNYNIKGYVFDGVGGMDSMKVKIIVRNRKNYEAGVKFTSSGYLPGETMSVIVHDDNDIPSISLEFANLNNGLSIEITGEKINYREYYAYCQSDELSASADDTIEVVYSSYDSQICRAKTIILNENINKPPTPVSLISPAYSDTVILDSEPDSVTFLWHSAMDPDGEDVGYQLINENLFKSDITEDTAISVAGSFIKEQLAAEADSCFATYWYVNTISNKDTVNCESRFRIVYQIKTGNTGSESESLPTEYALKQNFPNPFNSITTIPVLLPEKTRVVLVIYNIAGEKVQTLMDQPMPAGYHFVSWQTGEFTSGLYFYKLETRAFVDVRKCLLLK